MALNHRRSGRGLQFKTESLTDLFPVVDIRFLKFKAMSHKTAAGGVQCFLLKSDKLFTLNPTMFQNYMRDKYANIF